MSASAFTVKNYIRHRTPLIPTSCSVKVVSKAHILFVVLLHYCIINSIVIYWRSRQNSEKFPKPLHHYDQNTTFTKDHNHHSLFVIIVEEVVLVAVFLLRSWCTNTWRSGRGRLKVLVDRNLNRWTCFPLLFHGRTSTNCVQCVLFPRLIFGLAKYTDGQGVGCSA